MYQMKQKAVNRMSLYSYYEGINIIYRFWSNNEIIYIGKTTNIIKRFSHHTHLPDECYSSINYIDYAVVDSESNLDFYEQYYIGKYLPKYNQKKPNDIISVKVEELFFVPFKEDFSPVLDFATKKIDLFHLSSAYIEFKQNDLIFKLPYSDYKYMRADGKTNQEILTFVSENIQPS